MYLSSPLSAQQLSELYRIWSVPVLGVYIPYFPCGSTYLIPQKSLRVLTSSFWVDLAPSEGISQHTTEYVSWNTGRFSSSLNSLNIGVRIKLAMVRFFLWTSTVCFCAHWLHFIVQDTSQTAWGFFNTNISYFDLFTFMLNVKPGIIQAEFKFVHFDIFPMRCNLTQFIYFWKTVLHVSYQTKNCSLPIPRHQNAITTTNNRETTIWMENNTRHGMKQQFPGETHNKPENTNATKNPPKTG